MAGISGPPTKEIEETKLNEKKRRRKGSKKSGSESDENIDIDIDSNPLLGQIDKIVMRAFSSPATISALRSALLPDIISALKSHWDQKWEPLQERVKKLEDKVDKQEVMLQAAEKERVKTATQQEMVTTGRHNNLIVTGVEEKDDENILQEITEMVSKLELGLTTNSFNAKRVGQKKDNKPRPILLSFNSHWDKRKLYAARIKLRLKGMPNRYINEDMAKSQSEIFFFARKAKQDRMIKNTWTLNGCVYIRRNDGTEVLLVSANDLKSAVPLFDIAKYRK